jgi:hypothetical protein
VLVGKEDYALALTSLYFFQTTPRGGQEVVLQLYLLVEIYCPIKHCNTSHYHFVISIMCKNINTLRVELDDEPLLLVERMPPRRLYDEEPLLLGLLHKYSGKDKVSELM